MKVRYTAILLLLSMVVLVAGATDIFLLPQAFFLHKGDKLNLRMVSADYFENIKGFKYTQEATTKFMIHEGKTAVDLKPSAVESDSAILAYKNDNVGLHLIEMSQTYPALDIDRPSFIKELDQEQLTKLSEKASASFQQDLKVKYTSYLKTLYMVDKTTGPVFNKVLGQDLEIILQQNPYNASYGDDITALIKFKGKPLQYAHVDVVVRTSTGKVRTERIASDAAGSISFKLSVEGTYLLRMVNVEETKAKDVDYEKWVAAYTFAFVNNDHMPKSY